MNFDYTAFISCVIECVKSVSYVAVTYKGAASIKICFTDRITQIEINN